MFSARQQAENMYFLTLTSRENEKCKKMERLCRHFLTYFILKVQEVGALLNMNDRAKGPPLSFIFHNVPPLSCSIMILSSP
jgi:hypothetical protein